MAAQLRGSKARKVQERHIKDKQLGLRDIRHVETELRYLQRKYRTAHEWLPLVKYVKPDGVPDQVLRDLRDHINALREERVAHLTKKGGANVQPPKYKAFLKRRRLIYPKSSLMLRRWEKAVPQLADHYDYGIEELITPHLQEIPSSDPVPNPDLITGFVYSSGAKSYFVDPRRDDTTHEWGIMSYPQVGRDFVDAYGFTINAEIEVAPAFFVDPPDFMIVLQVLQYTLPKVPFDGLLSLNFNHWVNLDRVYGESTCSWLKWACVARTAFQDEDFPTSYQDAVDFFSLDNVANDISITEADFMDTNVRWVEVFSGQNWVEEGDVVRVYVGDLIYLSSWGGYCHCSGRATQSSDLTTMGVPVRSAGMAYFFSRIT